MGKLNRALVVMVGAIAVATGRADAGQTLLLRSMMVADVTKDTDAMAGLASASSQAKVVGVEIPEPTKFDEILRESGTVEVEVDLTSAGQLTKCRVIKSSGYKSLDSRAMRALQAAHYQPEIAGGKPVGGAYAVTIGFDEAE